MEKENQRLKTELQSKDTELQMIKVQKVDDILQYHQKTRSFLFQAVDEEKLKEREETIRQLKVTIPIDLFILQKKSVLFSVGRDSIIEFENSHFR